MLPSTSEYDRTWLTSVAKTIPPGASVLDAGAGQCQYRPLFTQQNYTSVDACVGDDNWDFSQIDIKAFLHDISVPSNAYDTVLLMNVLEHVPNPREVLTELSRVLKPGGQIYIAVPFVLCEHQSPYDFYRYTRYALTYLLRQAGFDVDYIHPVGGAVYRLYIILSEMGYYMRATFMGRVWQLPIYALKVYITVFRKRLEKFEEGELPTPAAWQVRATKSGKKSKGAGADEHETGQAAGEMGQLVSTV